MAVSSIDSAQTAPFELGEGEDACLLLHGFTGTPWEMRPLGEALARAGFFAKGSRRPGHALTPEAMLGVSLRDWLDAAEEALAALEGHRRVFVAGLSMGALIAIALAAKSPRVRALALLAPALKLRGRDARLARAIRPLPLMEAIRPWVEKGSVDLADPEARAQAPLLPRFPSTRLRDLWALQDLARHEAEKVRAPSLVALGEKDQVVDPGGVRELVRALSKSSKVRYITLAEAAHLLPRDLGHEVLADDVIRFFRAQ